MSKDEIISSGKLEAYITGDISEEDLAEVEAEIEKDPELRNELLQSEKLVERLVFLQAVRPSSYIKKSLFGKIAGTGPVSRPARGTLTIAASLMLALTSIFASAYFWSQWQESENQLSELIAQNVEIARNYNNVSNELQNVREDLQVLISPSFTRVVLEGTENAPQAQAVVYWNKNKARVYLNSSTLPALSADEQYQLWALIDGNPVDAGVFDANQLDFQTMKEIDEADAFAVTIEPRGGSENPTLAKLQVLGKV